MKHLLAIFLIGICCFLYACQDVDEARMHNSQGAELYQKGSLDEAIAEYKKAIAINPNLAYAYHNLGVAYHKQGKYDLAVESYKIAISLNLTFEEYPNLGDAYLEQEKYDLAISYYINAVNMSPYYKLADAYYKLAFAYQMRGYDKDLVIKYYGRAIVNNPRYVEAYLNRGFAYNSQYKYDLAIHSYKKLIDIDFYVPEAHFLMGNAYYRQGKYDLAIKSYQNALSINPNSEHVHYNFLWILSLCGDLAPVHYGLACLYSLNNEKNLSIESLQKTKNLDTNYIRRAKWDKDFDNIRQSPEFQELLGPVE